MTDNPGMADVMTRINMRSFRQAADLQKQGKVICIFPEGTRSRTGPAHYLRRHGLPLRHE
jgi:1-acyl-sn-glycerol-3-phosphate acyltransferase